jgi:hypothetical protein
MRTVVAGDAFGPRVRWRETRGVNAQRRIALTLEVGDGRAELPQAVHQIGNRALVHARHALQHEAAASRSQHRRERTHRRARVTEEQLDRAIRHRGVERTALAGDVQRAASDRPGHRHAKRAQRRHHDFGVLAVEHARHFRDALRERAQQQDAIGQALRAREDDGALEPGDGRQGKTVGKHAAIVARRSQGA